MRATIVEDQDTLREIVIKGNKAKASVIPVVKWDILLGIAGMIPRSSVIIVMKRATLLEIALLEGSNIVFIMEISVVYASQTGTSEELGLYMSRKLA